MNKCAECGIEITNPKFCSRSCSVRHTNKTSQKRKKAPDRFCECGQKISRRAIHCKNCYLKYHKAEKRLCTVCFKNETTTNKSLFCKECSVPRGKRPSNFCSCGKTIPSQRKTCTECFQARLAETRAQKLAEKTEKVKIEIPEGMSYCPKCKQLKDIGQFYSAGLAHYTYCRDCASNRSKSIKQKLKEECVKYKGGKCEKCGYNGCIAALEFHHKDPTQKDFMISRCNKSKLNDEIKTELDKCDLLCSNCHRETHYLLE